MSAEVHRQSLADQILQPQSAPGYKFAFTDWLKQEYYPYGLDPNRPVCAAKLQGYCPLEKHNKCPDKHPESINNLVCKHWLRGLCKRGDACEFLHEYNLRRMPECSYYSRTQTCVNGDDCLYLHLDPDAKRPACPHYARGFCPLGPRCANKHLKREGRDRDRPLCPYYLAGFCPHGGRPECPLGPHPKWVDPATPLPPPELRVEKTREQLKAEREERELAAERERERQREAMEEQNPGMAGLKFGRGGAGGGWRGAGGKRGRGGRHRGKF